VQQTAEQYTFLPLTVIQQQQQQQPFNGHLS